MTDQLDTNMMAREELATAMVPAPEDLLDDVGPLGQLYYLERLAYQVMKMYAATLSGDEAKDVGDNDPPARALQAISLACGNLDAACVLLDILPASATEGP